VRRPDCTLATVDHNVPYVFPAPTEHALDDDRDTPAPTPGRTSPLFNHSSASPTPVLSV
jgi:hypothetical protein